MKIKPFAIINVERVWEHQSGSGGLPKMTVREALTFFVLCGFADSGRPRGRFDPKDKTFRDSAFLSNVNVDRAIAGLVRKGYVTRIDAKWCFFDGKKLGVWKGREGFKK